MARARSPFVAVVMAAIMTAFGLLFCLRVTARRELKEVF
jgi:hypothetical protein